MNTQHQFFRISQLILSHANARVPLSELIWATGELFVGGGGSLLITEPYLRDGLPPVDVNCQIVL